MNENIWILIPAYNEEKMIRDVIRDVKASGFSRILVVDDGSYDATATGAKEEGAEVLRHVLNRGQGAALKSGISYLEEEYLPEIIVTMDADGQHQPSDIPKLIKPIQNGETDIVLGSRFLNNEVEIPFIRKTILKLGVIFTNIISHVHLTDTHNGLRAMNRKAYQNIDITHRGMEHASDIIDEISKKKLRYQECPVHIIYSPYSLHKGQKTSNFVKIAIKIILKKLL